MSPTPVTTSSPIAPASYSWEATDEQVAARYGIAIEEIVRFDLNTSPTPPALVARLLAAGQFETSLSEYPPSDYRRLVAAAATRYGVGPDEILVGAGADEILDLIGKAFLVGRPPTGMRWTFAPSERPLCRQPPRSSGCAAPTIPPAFQSPPGPSRTCWPA